MVSDRKRLGLIVPSSNSVMEVDFYRNLPPEITLHVARMYLYDTTVEGESQMLDLHFPKALTDIATVLPHATVFGCTSAGALRGNEYDAEICGNIEKVAGCKSVSVISSARAALERLNLKKIGVCTPYVEELNKRIKASFEADGVRVEFITGLGIDHNFSLAKVEPPDIERFVLDSIKGYNVEGLFISCTNFRAMEVYAGLEEKLGIPVLTSNRVALAAALEALK